MTIFKYDPEGSHERSNRIHVRGEVIWENDKRMFFTALLPFYEDIDEAAAIALVMKDSQEWKENFARVHQGEFRVRNVEFRLATATRASWCPIEIKL
jgi:hypothetical protein